MKNFGPPDRPTPPQRPPTTSPTTSPTTPPATPPAIHIRGLAVDRGRRHVIEHLDLDIPPGQIAGLLGPSGSGKTTLMRAIVGVQILRRGQVTVLDHPGGTAPLRRRVGYLTQAPSVYADLTVRENLGYFAKILGAEPGEVDRVIAAVDLASHADDAVARLSGGEKSRTSLAAALLGRPEVLILDEPTVGLDPVLRRDLWTLFRSLADAGTTLLVSSHVMDEAVHCDRLILMRDGTIVADATLPDLLARTGAADAEQAFLALIEAGEAA
jgi:ABC-2 type transport system ATP-binding protein